MSERRVSRAFVENHPEGLDHSWDRPPTRAISVHLCRSTLSAYHKLTVSKIKPGEHAKFADIGPSCNVVATQSKHPCICLIVQFVRSHLTKPGSTTSTSSLSPEYCSVVRGAVLTAIQQKKPSFSTSLDRLKANLSTPSRGEAARRISTHRSRRPRRVARRNRKRV